MTRVSLKTFRSFFPVVEKYVYLDHAGVAPVSTRVRDAIRDTAENMAREGAFAYPGWVKRIEDVRGLCAKLLNGRSGEIAFVRSTSHGLSLAARGLDWKPGDNVVFCEKDFPSNIFPWEHLKKRGIETRTVPNRGGRLEINDFEQRIDGRTRLVAVSSVQFVSGYRIDLRSLGEACKRNGALFCVDAIQSLGLLEMDVHAFGIDLLSADAHKWMLGPEGIGIFYCREGLAEQLDPALVGWKSVQDPFSFEAPNLELRKDAQRFEEGSYNLIGIAGMGAAIELLLEVGVKHIEERVLDMGERVIEMAEKRGFEVLTPRKRQERGGAITFRNGSDAAALRDRLREKGIMVNVRGGGLRVSPHAYNTEQEIERLFSAIDHMR